MSLSPSVARIFAARRRVPRALPAAAVCLLLAACASSLDPAVLAAVRIATDRIEAPARIDVPMVGTPELPLVEVRLNGRGPYRFLVDLGGNVVSIREDVAKAIGAETVQDLSERGVVKARTLQLGDTTFRDIHMVREPKLDVDGVIGFNVFREGLVTLDYPGQRFVWRSGELPASGPSIVPYDLRERMPYVTVTMGETRVSANLDTGARAAVIVPARLEGTVPVAGPLTDSDSMWNQAEGRIRTRSGTLHGDLRTASHVLASQPKVVFSPALEDEFLIGSGALTSLRLTLDTANKRMLIEPGPSRKPVH